MEPMSWVWRDETGKATAAITYLPERAGGQIHVDWGDNLSEGDWEITRGDTKMSMIHSTAHATEDTLRFLFEHPEDLLECIRWYWAIPVDRQYLRGVMQDFLSL